MANRQDSGSNSAHENQRPTSHNEDALPEMTEDTRNRADESDDDFEDDSDDLDEADEDAEDEGSI
jgi:hypothetical protein